MYYTLKTTIGDVHIKCEGHFIHVSTSQESLRDITINTWDHESRRPRFEMTIDNSFREVAPLLREYFPTFLALGMGSFGAPMDQLLSSQLIHAFATLKARNSAA